MSINVKKLLLSLAVNGIQSFGQDNHI